MGRTKNDELKIAEKFRKTLIAFFDDHPEVQPADVARSAGITPGYLSNIRTGRKPGTEATRKAIAMAIDVPYEHMLGEKERITVVHPDGNAIWDLFETIMNGRKAVSPETYAPNETIAHIKNPDMKPKIYRVMGEAMHPCIGPFSFIRIDPENKRIINDALYAIKVFNNDQAAPVVKRVLLQSESSYAMLKNDNPDSHFQPPRIIDRDKLDRLILGRITSVFTGSGADTPNPYISFSGNTNAYIVNIDLFAVPHRGTP